MSNLDTLVYSPVNFLAVDWSMGGKRFERCGLPKPRPCQEPDKREPECPEALPLPAPIITYDWDRWLPEIIVGVDDPTEEIAADFARAAAIEFCKQTRALQREIVIPLQHGEHTYPVPAVEFENVIGVIGAGINDEPRCRCQHDHHHGWLHNGVQYLFDQARSEIHLKVEGHCCYHHHHHRDVLRLLVWAAPKEYACEFDSFLYEYFRNEISLMARHNYVRNVHFRDTMLVGSLMARYEVERLWAQAKIRALSSHSFAPVNGRSGLFGGGERVRRWR